MKIEKDIIIMSRGLPQNVHDNLEKARSSAIAAVTIYNTPGLSFRIPLFLVLIVISWTAFFHALFFKKREKPWYRKKSSKKRYEYVDGEPKYWELSKCLKQHYKDNHPPERKNLEFLIGLRNKIEHRNLPKFEPRIYGQCQAALMNLEDALIKEFGDKFGLSDQLMISLQFSRVTSDEKKKAIKKLVTGEVKKVEEYIEKFHSGLGWEVLNSQKYSFRVFLVPKVVNRESAADTSVEFINAKNLTKEDLERRIKSKNVLIKEKQIFTPILNLYHYRPSDVVKELEKRLPIKVSMNVHTNAWKYFEVRPPRNDKQPEMTETKYCVYDKVHRDYLYTEAWINKLTKALSDPDSYKAITGRKQIHK